MKTFFEFHGLWWTVAAIAVAHGLRFALSRGPLAVRARRLGYLAGCAFLLRVLPLLWGDTLQSRTDTTLTLAAPVIAVLLFAAGRVWFVRIPMSELRDQIETACGGLFLQCEETSPGRFVLTTKGKVHVLRVIGDGGWLVVILPRLDGRDKISLLVDWLSRQFPGPVPRLHFVLKRSK